MRQIGGIERRACSSQTHPYLPTHTMYRVRKAARRRIKYVFSPDLPAALKRWMGLNGVISRDRTWPGGLKRAITAWPVDVRYTRPGPAPSRQACPTAPGR